MLWRVADHENVADPDSIRALLGRALEAHPNNPAVHLRLADLELDRYGFAAAARALETALRHDPDAPGARSLLARCHNVPARHRDALDVLGSAKEPSPDYERGVALQALADGRSVKRVPGRADGPPLPLRGMPEALLDGARRRPN